MARVELVVPPIGAVVAAAVVAHADRTHRAGHSRSDPHDGAYEF